MINMLATGKISGNNVLIIILGAIVWYFIIGFLWFLIDKYIRRKNKSLLLYFIASVPGVVLLRLGLIIYIWIYTCHWLGWINIFPVAD